MAHRSLMLAAAFGALSVGACNKTEARFAAVEFGKSKQAVQDAEKGMATALQAKDSAKLTSYYAADAVLAISGRPVAKGLDAIARINSADLEDPNFKFEFTNQQTDVADSGDLAFTQGRYKATWTNPKTNEPTTGTGTYVTVFRKQEDGSWKAIADISTPNG